MKVIVDDLLNDVVFVDLTKAFDTINREIILRKMSYLGVDLQEVSSAIGALKRALPFISKEAAIQIHNVLTLGRTRGGG